MGFANHCNWKQCAICRRADAFLHMISFIRFGFSTSSARMWCGTLALQHASVAQDCWCIGELALATAGHPMVMATAGVLLVLNSLLNVLLVLNSLLSAVMNCLPVS